MFVFWGVVWTNFDPKSICTSRGPLSSYKFDIFEKSLIITLWRPSWKFNRQEVLEGTRCSTALTAILDVNEKRVSRGNPVLYWERLLVSYLYWDQTLQNFSTETCLKQMKTLMLMVWSQKLKAYNPI